MNLDRPIYGESWMQFLMRTGRFSDCMIRGWQDVEDRINQILAQESGLVHAPWGVDTEVDRLRKLSFEKKVKRLRKANRLSELDATTVLNFAKERHSLFHGDIFRNQNPLTISAREKVRLMELANLASQITLNRGFGVWFDESTNDLGNKNIPKPKKLVDMERLFSLRVSYF